MSALPHIYSLQFATWLRVHMNTVLWNDQVSVHIAAWCNDCICIGSSAGWQPVHRWSLWEHHISYVTFHSIVHGMESHRSRSAVLLLHGTNCVCSGNTCAHICWYVSLLFSWPWVLRQASIGICLHRLYSDNIHATFEKWMFMAVSL